MHRATRACIEGELTQLYDGPTVVVTHHAPHPASLANPHADLSWCYASDLTDLIMERGPDLWIHGHVHWAADYWFGQTRVVCNQRGHADEETGFESEAQIAVRRTVIKRFRSSDI